jgi:hypothetical protein
MRAALRFLMDFGPGSSYCESELDRLYTGTLINDLRALVERAEQFSESGPRQSLSESTPRAHHGEIGLAAERSEPKKLAQPLGLSPADWNLALLLIVHAQLIRTLKPGHNFADTIDVHQVRAVSAPEQAGVQAGK